MRWSGVRSSLLVAVLLTPLMAGAADPVIIGYVFPPHGVLQPGQIDPHAMTRINYAFAKIQGGKLVVGAPADAQNLTLLSGLRKQNPELTVLISVGGWTGSAGFSEMAASRTARRVFIDSAMEFIERYDLDGLDVDWEYPGMPGAGHAFLPEDKENFTSLVRELRERFDRERERTGRKLYLSIAAGTSEEWLAHTQMGEVAKYTDTVNVMAYDYYQPESEPITGNHAPLYADPADPRHVSADGSVKAFEAAGVPAEKLVLGMPFYAHVWASVPDVHHGLFQPGKAAPGSEVQYADIAGLLRQGYTRYWDAAAHVPYLYNPATKTFVSYEDPQSAADKCRYLRAHHLAGVMFWQYMGDNGELLHAIARGLHSP